MFRIVSLGWFPEKPPLTDCKGQVSTPLLKEYVKEMLEMNAIIPTGRKIFQSCLLLVDKKGTSKKRMVLDISYLNKFIPCKKLRRTTAKAVRQVIDKRALDK